MQVNMNEARQLLAPHAKRHITAAVVYHAIGALRGAKVGDTLTVLYLPEAPEQAMPYIECAYKAVASPEERST